MTVGTDPVGLTLSTDGSTLYVADHSSNNIDVVNTTTGMVGAPLALPGGDFPTDVQTGTSNRLWVVAGGTVLQINATTGASAGASFGAPGGDIRVTPNGATLLAADYGNSPSQLDVLDVSGTAGNKYYTVYPGSNGDDLEISADGSTFVLICGGGNGFGAGYSVDTYSVADGTSHSNVLLGARSFAFSRDGTIGYAGQVLNDTIHEFALSKDSSGILDLGTEVGQIAASNEAQKLFSATNGNLFVDEGTETEIFGTATSITTPTTPPVTTPTQVTNPVTLPGIGNGVIATKTIIVQSPTSGTRGRALGPIVVDLTDQIGDLASTTNSAITISIASGPAGATLGGVTTMNATGGIATFGDVIPDMAGTYTLNATSSALIAGLTPKAIKVARPLVASKLVFAETPATTKAGVTIAPAITVYVETESGEIVTTDDSDIRISIRTGPTGATVLGTLVVSAKKGVATFKKVLLPTKGTYRLIVRDGSLTSATTKPFTIKK